MEEVEREERAGENCESRSGGWTLQSDSERQTPGNRSFLITVLPIINAHATTCWVESATTETPACLSTTRLINIAVSYLFLHTGSNSYSPYPLRVLQSFSQARQRILSLWVSQELVVLLKLAVPIVCCASQL